METWPHVRREHHKEVEDTGSEGCALGRLKQTVTLPLHDRPMRRVF